MELSSREPFQFGAVDDENIRPPVIVVVKIAMPVPVVSMMYFLVSTPLRSALLTRPCRQCLQNRPESVFELAQRHAALIPRR